MKLLLSILRSINSGTLLAAAVSFGASHGWAQTAHFGGVQTTTPITFSSYGGVAVDSAGDVFVADDTNDRIVESNASGDTAIEIAGGTPQYLALDLSKNLYVTTTSPAAVKKLTRTGSGYGAAVTLSNRFLSPWGVGVDSLGDVFVVDHGGNALYKLAPNGSSYTLQLINDTTFNGPDELAIDANNRLYIADGGHNRVVAMNTSGTLEGEWDFPSSPTGVAVDAHGDLAITGANLGLVYETPNPNGNGVYTSTLLGSNFIAPYGVAFDAAGNMYVNDSGARDIVRQSPMTANFGAVNVGSTSPPLSLAFVFDLPGTLNSVQALTQGAPNLDFKTTSGGSCVPGTAGYFEGATCTVAAAFVPMGAGARFGAVQLMGAGGKVLGTGYVQGNGEGAQIAFAPVQGAINNAVFSMGVAVDGTGNLYEADTFAGTVLKQGPSAGTASPIVTGLSTPSAVAVDGAGNVYIADAGKNQVVKESFSGGAYSPNFIFANLSDPTGVAVDGAGNVYIADSGNNRVLKETVSGIGYIQSSIGSNLNAAFCVAVDGAGNVYIADTGDNVVLKETLSGGVYTQSLIGALLKSPRGVAVDSTGDVYISDTGNSRVLKEMFYGGSYHQSSIGSGITFPTALAVDGSGDVYIPDSANYRVVIETVSHPPAITFPSMAFGQTSSAVATTITNLGNQPLTFPAPIAGSNPSTAANFVLETNGDTTCPVTDPNSLAGTLPANESCTLSYRFEPQEAGAFNGTSVLSDNNLGAAAATQSISLTGSATQVTPVIKWATPSPITYGVKLSAAQLDATSSVAGTFAYNPMVGTALAPGTHTLWVTFTPTDTVDYKSATATVVLTVDKATASITWATPAAITYGTKLSATQDNATASVAGAFTYSPEVGTTLTAGSHMLTATFTPTDTVDYQVSTATVTLTVNQATPNITWVTPAPINHGAALSSTQLDATANVAGTFVYNPKAGTVLATGNQKLSTTFTPTDSVDYKTATATVVLKVN